MGVGVGVRVESPEWIQFEIRKNCFLALNLAGAGTERVVLVPRGRGPSQLNWGHKEPSNRPPRHTRFTLHASRASTRACDSTLHLPDQHPS